MKKTALSLLLALSLYASTNHSAKVLETLNSGGYTYMKVQDGGKNYWIAMTQRKVKVGDIVKYSEQGWMRNFHSKTLNRTFDTILFAADVTASHNTQNIVKAKPDIMKSTYQKKNTQSIAQLFKNRNAFANKTVLVHGKVTKVSQAIMGLNWVHIQDGSRFAGRDDLVFTTKENPPKVGELVYASGTLIKDKDFGYGYFYPVIIQEATFKK